MIGFHSFEINRPLPGFVAFRGTNASYMDSTSPFESPKSLRIGSMTRSKPWKEFVKRWRWRDGQFGQWTFTLPTTGMIFVFFVKDQSSIVDKRCAIA